MLLHFVIPSDCSPDYLVSILPPARAPFLDRRLAGTALVMRYNGTDADKDLAQAELQAALVDAGSLGTADGLHEEQ